MVDALVIEVAGESLLVRLGEPPSTEDEGSETSETGPDVLVAQEEQEAVGVAEVEEEEEVSNPILPTGNELLFGGIFFVLLWALMKFVLLKPVVQTMDDRTAKVRGDQEGAEAARAQMEAAEAEYEAALAAARAEATRVVEDARARADARRAELMAAAEADVATAKAAAADEVAQAKAEAMAELRGQVAGIAVGAASAVVQRQLDAAAQQQLIDRYLSQTGSQN